MNKNVNSIIEGLHNDSVNESGLTDKVKTWYIETYPDDELGKEIKGTVTFKKVYDTLGKGSDIYKLLGVGDSTIRERVFQELANRQGGKKSLDTIYNLYNYGGWNAWDRVKMGM